MRMALLVASVSLVLVAGCGGPPEGPRTPPSAASAPEPPHAAPETGPTTTTTALPSVSDEEVRRTKLTPASGHAPSAATAPTPAEEKPGAAARGKGAEPGRSREDIQAIIVARRDEARACYDEGVKRSPGLEGDLDIKWTIDPEGQVTEAAVDDARSTIHDRGVADCVMAVIKRVHFAKSAKGFESRAHYPFNFHPKQNPVGK
jgi:hypothetical protein